MRRTPALDPKYIATRVSARLPGNEISDQRNLLIQLPVNHRRSFFEAVRLRQATSKNFIFFNRDTGEFDEYP